MENLSLSINVIITGMVVVFSSLLVLSLIISLFGKVSNTKKNRPDNPASADNQPEGSDTASYSESVSTQTKAADSDSELIAVLTVAIMASGMTRPDTKIRVTSYRRIPVTSPVWNIAGRTEVISGRL
ncbi:MAG TPA: hypothetical protein GXX20_04025 [Clostridiaceae bacterium]|nr:hypothetical protein [Clostridiaceae bacterium]